VLLNPLTDPPQLIRPIFISRRGHGNNRDEFDSDDECDSSKRYRRDDNDATMKKNQPENVDADIAVVRIPPYHYVHVLDQVSIFY
jgi:hypothetical protein